MTTQHPISIGWQAGFTLLELVVSLFLMGLLTAIFGLGIVHAVEGYQFSRTNVHLAQKSQLAMARMRRELMELTDIVAVSGAGEDPFIIYERLVQGNTPSVARLGIHHHRASATIRLYTDLSPAVTHLDDSTIDQGDLLIDGVDSLSLAFFQGEDPWSPGNDLQLLSTIGLDITLARPDKPGATQDFQTRIYLRNTNNFGGAAPTTTPVSRADYNCFIHALLWDSGL
jgi:prepilin-type N-terminal cleavage/methylation domain-containing protein